MIEQQNEPVYVLKIISYHLVCLKSFIQIGILVMKQISVCFERNES